MEKYQKLIEEAPKLAKERERARREQFITRAARTEHRYGSRAALPDNRYDLNVGSPIKQPKRLRSERKRGRNTFFVLLVLLALAVAYLYFTITNP